MRNVISVVAAIIGTLCTSEPTKAEAEGADWKTVFERRLDDRRALVVSRAGPAAPERLTGIVNPKQLEPLTGITCVRLELREKEKPPLLLGSRLIWEAAAAYTRGFDVLDILVEHGKITLAITEGSRVVVWQVGVLGDDASRATVLRGAWSTAAAVNALDRDIVKATLARTKDGRLAVELVDLRGTAPYQHAYFEEVENCWEFKLTKTWVPPASK